MMKRTPKRGLWLLASLGLLAELSPPVALSAEPSPEYKASLRRTLELRKQRRQARGAAASLTPVGVIVPYPMPPSLIIRHTREVHDEIGAFLELLRRS
jgi:hypothetical protein